MGHFVLFEQRVKLFRFNSFTARLLRELLEIWLGKKALSKEDGLKLCAAWILVIDQLKAANCKNGSFQSTARRMEEGICATGN